MKKVASLVFLLSMLFAQSCSTDFQLEGPWKNIPIVYAFLSIQDTAHYIRVEKAFLEPGGNALDIAQIPDSIYYNDDEITVQLEKNDGVRLVNLRRVDGNKEGYPREEGVFADDPNYLYKIGVQEIDFEGGDLARLILNRGDELEKVTAETRILGDMEVSNWNDGDQINLTDYNRNLTVRWQSDDFTQIFDVRFIVHYSESDPDNPSGFIDKSAEWILQKNLKKEGNNSITSISTKWGNFYEFLAANLEEAPVLRRFRGMDLQITGSGQELVDFFTVAQANVGITSSQAIPVYSNLSEGQGIFTSRTATGVFNIGVAGAACDSLKDGVITAHLNFASCN